MSAYEPEIEEALKRYSLSSYAIFNAGNQPQVENLLNSASINDLFIGRTRFVKDGTEYTHQESDLHDLWKKTGLRNYGTDDEGNEYSSAEIISRARFPYPILQMDTKLPTLDGRNFVVHTGFEYGTGQILYHMHLTHSVGNQNTTVRVDERGHGSAAIRVDGFLPADYDTAKHSYVLKANRNALEFYLDGRLRGIILLGASMDQDQIVIGDNTEPYVVGCFRSAFHGEAPMKLRNTRSTPLSDDDKYEWPVMPNVTEEEYERGVDNYPDTGEFGFQPGDPLPPRTYRLYDWQADTLMTSGTYDTGTSHKSHPIPIHGYDGKTLLFRADTDSVTDGLQIEVYTQEGNWRVYDSVTTSANSLESYVLTGNFPLARIGYEPSADGASITDAEAHLR